MSRKRREEAPLCDSSHVTSPGVSPSKRPRDSLSQGSQSEVFGMGAIESVHLKNFMCHSKLDFHFDRGVNFIVGKNGSGKSAILTSLMMGLGGRAANTGRGTSIKGLVETGKRSAEVIVKLGNKGTEAYRPDVYGPSIIVQRRLGHDGSSSYKIKAADGTNVSCKREELDSILDHFGLQIDNPVMILNQETSRNFLQSKSPGDKYRFFMKATQLEKVINDYKRSEQESTATEIEVERKVKLVSEMRKEVIRLENQWRHLQSMDDLGHKLECLQKELLWAEVAREEKALQELDHTCCREADDIEKLKKKIEKSESTLASRTDTQQTLQQELHDNMKQLQEAKMQSVEFRKQAQAHREEFKECEAGIRRIDRDVDRKMNEYSILKGRIEELRSVDQDKTAQEKEMRAKELGEIEERLKQLHSELSTVKHHHEQMKGSESAIVQSLQMTRNEQSELQERKSALERSIRQLEASKSDQLLKYGANMPKLLQAIENAVQARRFKMPPKGPLGSLLKLKDPQWDLATEVCLRNILPAFLCDNQQDSQTLHTLMRQVMGNERKPPIIVSSYIGRVYDYRNEILQSDKYISVLENLDIEDPDVINCLIDQRSIEKIALIPTNHEARTALMHRTTVPRNCWEAFTAKGDQLYPAPNFRYYSATKRRAELLKVAVDDQIRERSAELVQLDEQRNELQSKLRALQVDLNQHRKELCTIGKQMQELRREDVELRSRGDELRNVEEPEPTNIATLEDALAELVDEVQTLKGQRSDAKRTLSDIRAVCMADAEESKKQGNASKLLLQAAEATKERLIVADTDVQKVQDVITLHQQQIASANNRLAAAQEQKKNAATKLEERISEVITVAPERISTRRTTTALNNEIENIEEQLEAEAQRSVNREAVHSRYKNAKAKYEDAKEGLEKLKVLVTTLKEDLVERHKKYCMLCEQVVLRLRLIFTTTLLQQNFQGDLKFDNKKQQLHIQVKPNEQSCQMQQDLKALSGGERSFSTVCFVLALWEAMECPFRVMDEFDIFMDMGRRRVSLEMILEMTRKSGGQFIFLTPIELPPIPALSTAKIMMMPDPCRFSGVARNVQAVGM